MIPKPGMAKLYGACVCFTGLDKVLPGLAELYGAWQRSTGAWQSFMGLGNAAWQGEGKIIPSQMEV